MAFPTVDDAITARHSESHAISTLSLVRPAPNVDGAFARFVWSTPKGSDDFAKFRNDIMNIGAAELNKAKGG